MEFVKMEGIGNDFIVTHETVAADNRSFSDISRMLCDRRRGIGGDGVLYITSSRRADFQMRIFNSDGSEAEMCGNGIRCCARYIDIMGIGGSRELAIETLAGIIGTEMLENGMVRVDMGPPRLESEEIPVVTSGEKMISEPLEVSGEVFSVTAVSMGNPHAVIYTDVLTDRLVHETGPLIESHQIFPRRTNVEFIKVISPQEIQMRVWERGCGETEACGTGACAAVVSGIINKLHGSQVTVHLPGGDLYIEWSGECNDPVYMTGPARVTFSGEIDLNTLQNP